MAGIKPRSCKAKGRVFQQLVRDKLREVGKIVNLVNEDIESRGMGQPGVDIILSPAAQRELGNLQIECKKVEKLNVIETYMTHANRYKDIEGEKLLIHTRNSTSSKKIPVLVTLSLESYLAMIEDIIIKDFVIKGYENLEVTGSNNKYK